MDIVTDKIGDDNSMFLSLYAWGTFPGFSPRNPRVIDSISLQCTFQQFQKVDTYHLHSSLITFCLVYSGLLIICTCSNLI